MRLSFVSVVLAILAFPQQVTGASTVSFERDVRPILSEHCSSCHGPDETHRKAKLRVDTKDGLFEIRRRGTIVVPGSPEDSLLFQRLVTRNPDEIMPPLETKKTLEAEEIALIRRWIEEGAAWSEHWSFVPPRHPVLPEVSREAWVRQPFDRFVLARLEAAGLDPSPEADRRTLIRRLSFDLTGLPPTLEEVESFVADPRGDAVEHLADRLLASERYGERMALAWMDAARYGDSSVYHADGVRDMWPWRDWVIRAYNANKPFDEFTVEQLAGDLLPEADWQTRVASGFHRNHGTTDEGGAIDEEYRVEYIVDRVKTTSIVWLGLTMECAQCHEHKYDPISQNEYYRFYAYFNQAQDRGMQTRGGNAPPLVRVPDTDSALRLEDIRSHIAGLESRREGIAPTSEEFDAWLASERAGRTASPNFGSWHAIGPFTAPAGSTGFTAEFGPERDLSLDAEHDGRKWTPRDIPDAASVDLGLPGNSALYLRREVTIGHDRTIELALGSDDGLQVWLDGERVHANDVSRGVQPDQDRVPLRLTAGTHVLLFKVSNGGGASGFFFRSLTATIPDEIRALIAKTTGDDAASAIEHLRGWYANEIWSGRRDIDAEIASQRAMETEIENALTTCMVLADVETPRMTYILQRGQYDAPRLDQSVEPGVPAFLPPLAEDAPANRLGLARWIVDDDHPLTARVAVNRYWQIFFGEGLVRTMGDFGTRGDPPSHPEVLDWLARDFIESGWDTKRLLRRIVLSATYLQSSHHRPDGSRVDPENRLLWRGPRFRLQGEFIRDQALDVAGLLVDTIGGPSVKPYQPPRIWNEVSLDGNLRYQPDTGEKLYRRGMYVYWKRSAPLPSLMAFDAPTREMCVIQRPRTNTPLQALVTLNDVQFVEAARMFAERILREGGEDFASRVDLALLLTTARPADAARRRILGGLYERQLAAYRAAPDAAKELLSFGEHPRDARIDEAEHAAWTVVASAILNLDEVLTKE